MIRVLVVDDSGFMRLALRRIIEADGDLRVIGEAANGQDAVEAALRLKPDVIAMDIEMPGLDGIAATERIMAQPDPPAILMVSHHTKEGSEAALAALDKGAVDYLWKGSPVAGLDLGQIDRELRGRLRHWAAARLHRAVKPSPEPARTSRPVATGIDLILIGASTGGPDAVAALLGAAGAMPVGCVVAQHMPEGLAPEFARHLAARTGRTVRVADRGDSPEPGVVLVLPGGTDGHLVRASREDGRLMIRLADGGSTVHPSVDLLFQSAAIVAKRALGVVLTGMGRDGTAGAKAMTDRGMPVLAQSPESCVVAGMPRAVINAGYAAETGDPVALGRRLSVLARLAVVPQ
ncbi:chemotaxis-specific protein-glutamate methyltransferase CheB [Acetobacteraceae bacterium H6797]|nr:chemotaxis-specific protein-glutamate methyltransferase CheB [Acetobacteraceae bacterium H6797]